jgi:DNA invertase Pin-like site-specific DNA recombinase
MQKAIIYARVSSKEQEEEGYSLAAQLKQLQGYARSHHFQVVREFVCAESVNRDC